MKMFKVEISIKQTGWVMVVAGDGDMAERRARRGRKFWVDQNLGKVIDTGNPRLVLDGITRIEQVGGDSG
jgi:hypothetical protein